jgi:tetratricopeptide (TPR) repeat protein
VGKRHRSEYLPDRTTRPLLALFIFLGGSIPVIAAPQDSANATACSGAEHQLRSAKQAIDQGHFDEAERLLLPLQTSHPECGEVLLTLARVRASQKDANVAEQLFSRSVELTPNDARSYSYYAEFSFTQGDYVHADYLSDRALSLDGEYPEALLLKGQILVMKGQIPAARELLEKACTVAPDNAEAHFQLAAFFDARKLNHEAVQHFERTITLRPGDPRAYDYLALNLESLGEAKKADAAYRKGLAVNKGPFFDYFVDYNYGRFLLKQNRLEESKVYLDRSLRLAPETRAVYYEHGKLNVLLHRYQEARRDAERALGLADSSGFVLDLQVYYLLTTVYSRLGEQELARKYAELSRSATIPIQYRARN